MNTQLAPSKRLAGLVADNGAYRGNACTDVQISTFVRPTDETQCNGFDFPRGQLRDFDLKPYRKHFPWVLRMIQRHTADTTVLYVWRTKHTTYGATLATPDGQVIERQAAPGGTWAALKAVLYLEGEARLINGTTRGSRNAMKSVEPLSARAA